MKFKTKTKVLATIVGATMMPVVLPSNIFMTTQVCYAAERMSLDQALTELHDITMKLLNMENLETREEVFEYLDDNMDRIKNLTYAVLNYARISEENFNAVRQWHRDKFADLKERQDYERANNPIFAQLADLKSENKMEEYEVLNRKVGEIPSLSKFHVSKLMSNSLGKECLTWFTFSNLRYGEALSNGNYESVGGREVDFVIPTVAILRTACFSLDEEYQIEFFNTLGRDWPDHYETSVVVSPTES